jgi:hypothetical protein
MDWYWRLRNSLDACFMSLYLFNSVVLSTACAAALISDGIVHDLPHWSSASLTYSGSVWTTRSVPHQILPSLGIGCPLTMLPLPSTSARLRAMMTSLLILPVGRLISVTSLTRWSRNLDLPRVFIRYLLATCLSTGLQGAQGLDTRARKPSSGCFFTYTLGKCLNLEQWYPVNRSYEARHYVPALTPALRD